MAKANKTRMAEQCGMPPKAFDGMDTHRDLVVDKREGVTFVHPGRGSAGRRTVANRNASGFNLKGVMEVLEEYGLDPVAETARILKETKPARARDGSEVRDAKGEIVMVPVLDIELRTKVLMELTNFIHPKLKAVEHTRKPDELTESQVEARLAQLLVRAAAKAAD